MRCAGGLWRAGKDFFGALAAFDAMEKSFSACWRATARWKSLFWDAGRLQRLGKVFFGALADDSGVEKWRTLAFL